MPLGAHDPSSKETSTIYRTFQIIDMLLTEWKSKPLVSAFE